MQAGLNERIQQFYDRNSGVWEAVWGEHMHHGFYEPGQDPRQAQVRLIEALLHWGGVETCQQALDVGCGIGGSSLWISERYGAAVTGITLSPVQAARAQARAAAAQLPCQFRVADALAMPFEAGCFDLVWSLESGEHMADKAQFLAECTRVLAPGGRLIMATWCHREGGPTPADQALLQKIYDIYCLPYVVSLSDYVDIATALPLTDIRAIDWSAQVAPFWDYVWASALRWSVIPQMLRGGWPLIRSAWAVRYMQQGYASGAIRFGVVTAKKA